MGIMNSKCSIADISSWSLYWESCMQMGIRTIGKYRSVT